MCVVTFYLYTLVYAISSASSLAYVPASFPPLPRPIGARAVICEHRLVPLLRKSFLLPSRFRRPFHRVTVPRRASPVNVHQLWTSGPLCPRYRI